MTALRDVHMARTGALRSTRFAFHASVAVALLVAVASLGGIAESSIYARETPLWRTQGLGQDWANLLVAVPWLVVSTVFAVRGSRRGRILLAGALVYTTYTYAVYAFDVHFNALFLVYCGALGTSAYALIALVPDLRDAASWFEARAPRRFAGGFAIACALAFALLWLSQIVPALVHGTVPPEIEAAGLMTNPAHVLDLALVIPAMAAGGWQLWHGRPLGYALVPVLLGFLALMGVALAAMMIALAAHGLSTSRVLVVAFGIFVGLAVVALGRMLRAMTPR